MRLANRRLSTRIRVPSAQRRACPEMCTRRTHACTPRGVHHHRALTPPLTCMQAAAVSPRVAPHRRASMPVCARGWLCATPRGPPEFDDGPVSPTSHSRRRVRPPRLVRPPRRVLTPAGPPLPFTRPRHGDRARGPATRSRTYGSGLQQCSQGRSPAGRHRSRDVLLHPINTSSCR